MRIRHGLCVAAIVAGSLAVAPGASAATEFGDSCAATNLAPEYTFTTLSGSSGALPLTAPSSGVITKLKTSVGVPLPFSVPMTAKVLRSAGGKSFTVVDQASLTAGSGVTIGDARLSVQAGDRLGLRGQAFTYEGSPIPPLTFFCPTPTAVLGGVNGEVPPGSTAEFPELGNASVPLVGVLEPDADNDGFGDETQDKCPQAAAVQVECPVIVLDSFPLAKKNAIVVLVSASEAGSVTVSGSAKLPKVKKARSSAKAKLKKVTRAVTPGKIARFTLRFPGSLRGALRSLPRGKKITVKLQASATNVAGQVSKDKAKLKLKG